MASDRSAFREEFRVVISGIRITDEQRDRIDAAVQQAALQAVADLDFAGDQAAVMFPISPRTSSRLPDWLENLGKTRGIWIGDFPEESLDRWIQSQ